MVMTLCFTFPIADNSKSTNQISSGKYLIKHSIHSAKQSSLQNRPSPLSVVPYLRDAMAHARQGNIWAYAPSRIFFRTPWLASRNTE